MAVTQEQIAKLAGVSRGTVDRTLNNRGRVDPEVAQRIRSIADELGYSRNRAGSLLVRSKNPLRIGVVIQSVKTAFMHCIWDEIEAARPRMREMGAELIVRTIDFIDAAQQLRALDELAREGVDGLALTPVEDEHVCDRIDEIAQTIPVVAFNTDLIGSRRLCYVGQDSYAAGRTCAGLMGVLLGGKGRVLTVTGSLFNLSHQRRVEGFRSEILSAYPGVTLLPMRRANDDRQTAYEIVRDALASGEALAGIYVAANGQAGACDAIREAGLQGKVRLICHDLTEENRDNIRSGVIDFLVDQDAQTQAVRPLEVLLDYILEDKRPAEEYMLTRIDIRNKYNI